MIRNTGPARSSSSRAVSLALTAREVSPEEELIAHSTGYSGKGINNNLDNNKIEVVIETNLTQCHHFFSSRRIVASNRSLPRVWDRVGGNE